MSVLRNSLDVQSRNVERKEMYACVTEPLHTAARDRAAIHIAGQVIYSSSLSLPNTLKHELRVSHIVMRGDVPRGVI